MPSPAMIVALIALLVAMGGTTYAAINLPANSVGTKQLKKASVTNKTIKKGAVGTNKIADRAVTKAKLNLDGVTVPDAVRADTALHADNATHAGNANSLGGQSADSYRDRCPSGTTAVGGECFETTERAPERLFLALLSCASSGHHLPTPAQLAAYGRVYGIPDFEWAGDPYFDVTTAQYRGMVYRFFQGETSIAPVPVLESTSQRFRCVVNSSNG